MNYQIVISGVGGQGVLFVTGLLANACMDKGEPVLTSETHGMAQRGGTVISHLKIGDYASPLIRPGNAQLLIVLKSENLAQHREFLKSGGTIVVNAPSTSSSPVDPSIISIDADALAARAGQTGSVNLYMLGAALAAVPVCHLDRIKDQIRARLAGKPPALTENALAAVETGFQEAGK